jgi:ATP-dependent Clp protease adapter protein ClpS
MVDKFGIHTDEGLEIKERQEVKTPPLFKVFLLNDDYTTMEFVVHVLEKVFPLMANSSSINSHSSDRPGRLGR